MSSLAPGEARLKKPRTVPSEHPSIQAPIVQDSDVLLAAVLEEEAPADVSVDALDLVSGRTHK